MSKSFLAPLSAASGSATTLGIEPDGTLVNNVPTVVREWLYGTGTPSAGGGADGDRYLQSNGAVWAKIAGSWVYTGINLTGPAGSGGGGITVSQTTINITSPGLYFESVVAVVGITSTTKIMSSFQIETDSENDSEEIQDSNIEVFAIAETDQIRFILTSDSLILGNFKINYFVG